MSLKSLIEKMDEISALSEATKETSTGRVHKAEPGGYGRKDDEDEEGKKVEPVVKRGRGRPKKDSDSDSGEEKKWDFSALLKPVKLKDPTGKETKRTTVTKMSDAEKAAAKKEKEEEKKEGKKRSLKDWVEHIEMSILAEGNLINELALDQSQVAVPSVAASSAPKTTTSTSGTSTTPATGTTTGAKVIDFKNPNDPLKAAIQKAVQNKEVTVLGEEDEIMEKAPPGMEDVVLALKKKFPGQEGRAYAIAWSQYNKKHGKTESVYESKTSVMEGYTLEDVIGRFPHEHKACQEGWGMDEGLYEALCDHYFKEGRIPHKVWHGSLDELRRHVEECYMKDTQQLNENPALIAAASRVIPGAINAAATGFGMGIADKLFTDKNEVDEALTPNMYKIGDKVFWRNHPGKVVDFRDDHLVVELPNSEIDIWPVEEVSTARQGVLPTIGKDIKDIGKGLKGFFTGKSEIDEEMMGEMNYATEEMEDAMNEDKKWIQKAIKHPGALKKQLGVPADEKIPAGKLEKAAHAGGKLGQRARLAQTLKGLKKQGVAENVEDEIKKHNNAVEKMTKKSFGNLDWSHPDLLKKSPQGYVFSISHKIVPSKKKDMQGVAEGSEPVNKESVNKKSILRTYRRNENNNNHSENAVLLAKNFGTPEELKKAQDAVDYRNKEGGYSMSDPKAKAFLDFTVKIHEKYYSELTKKDKKDPQMENWERELKNLLNEGMTITTSTGQPGGMDTVSISATENDAQTLMKILQHSGLMKTGGTAMSSPSKDDDHATVTVEPVSSDEVMGTLEPESDDRGDTALNFLKRMLGARNASGSCENVEEMHNQAASPGDAHISPVPEEEEMEEGNAFTGALAKAKKDGIQPGETMTVGGKKYPVKEAHANPEDFADMNEEALDQPATMEGDDWADAGEQDIASAIAQNANDEEDAETEKEIAMSEDEDTCNECGMYESKCGCDHGDKQPIEEGRMKEWLWTKAETTSRENFIADAGEMGMSKEDAASWWDDVNGEESEEKLDEWANSPQNKLEDEQFKTEMEFMTKTISGGLNNIKQDKTVMPSTRVVTAGEHAEPKFSMAEMLKKLQNIN